MLLKKVYVNMIYDVIFGSWLSKRFDILDIFELFWYKIKSGQDILKLQPLNEKIKTGSRTLENHLMTCLVGFSEISLNVLFGVSISEPSYGIQIMNVCECNSTNIFMR